MNLENLKKMSDNVEIALDDMAKKQVCGQDLETASAEQLNVTDDNLDEAVSIQPQAISYFTACMSAAKRNLDRTKFEYSLWRKEKHIAIKFASTVKLTADDLEAKIDVENKKELLEWREKLQEAQQLFDNSESIYEGWKQKGFALNQHAKLKNQDYISTSGGSIMEKSGVDSFSSMAKRVRDIQQKKKQKESENEYNIYTEQN